MTKKSSVSVLNMINPPLRWEPERGVATNEFLRNKSMAPNGPRFEELTSGDDCVFREAQRILGRCLPPTVASGAEAGLVVGFVQSGKTMSFETVISLARDNGYGLVIVLAGTKTNLREQSEDRLIKDLGIDEGKHWHHYSNPAKNDSGKIRDKLEAWKKKRDKKRAVLITLLKRQNYLASLSGLLKGLPLDNIPALLIDDESDQASLNTNAARIKAKRAPATAQSAVYNGICEVRQRLPHHSLLQYTATPQANLLLAQTDLLNPSFAELVTPGDDYAGGKSFFKDHKGLVIDIPSNDVPNSSNIVTSVPKSLVSALRYFMLAAAHHSLTPGKGDRNRSMMIHPAMKTASHKVYKDWIDKSFKAMKSLIQRSNKSNPELVLDLFKAEYELLSASFPAIKPLSDLVSEMAEEVLDEVNIAEINRTPDAEKNVNWKSTPYWILVGGEKLGRGYTVEGLVVTYMPRPLGTSPAADTLQQRARFFGYKKTYLGLCRVFVQGDVREAFSDYVDHEESVRGALSKNRGKSLKLWRRDFILDASLKATRSNVIGLDTRRIFVQSWLVPDVLHRDADAACANRRLLEEVERNWSAKCGPKKNVASLVRYQSAKNPPPHFVVESVPLATVLEEFLLNVEMRDARDAEEHSAMLIGLAELLDKDKNLVVDVFLMNNLKAQYRSRTEGRGFQAIHQFAPIGQYFSQSANVFNDKSFFTSDRISLQLRRFNIGTKPKDESSADIREVAWFALYVPRELAKHLHIEERC